QLAPGRQTADVLRSSLAAMRETAILRLGGDIVAAAFGPRLGRLLVASSNGRAGIYDRAGHRLAMLPRQPTLTAAVWSSDGMDFATGRFDGRVTIWHGQGTVSPIRYVSTPSPVTTLSFVRTTLLIGSGTHV